MDKQEWEGIGALEQTALALDWSSTCANALLLGYIWQTAMQWIYGPITNIWQTTVQQKCKYVLNLINCAIDLQRTRPLYYNCSSNLTSEQGDLTCGEWGRGIHYLRFWLNPCGCKFPHITNFSLYIGAFSITLIMVWNSYKLYRELVQKKSISPETTMTLPTSLDVACH